MRRHYCCQEGPAGGTFVVNMLGFILGLSYREGKGSHQATFSTATKTNAGILIMTPSSQSGSSLRTGVEEGRRCGSHDHMVMWVLRGQAFPDLCIYDDTFHAFWEGATCVDYSVALAHLRALVLRPTYIQDTRACVCIRRPCTKVECLYTRVQ